VSTKDSFAPDQEMQVLFHDRHAMSAYVLCIFLFVHLDATSFCGGISWQLPCSRNQRKLLFFSKVAVVMHVFSGMVM